MVSDVLAGWIETHLGELGQLAEAWLLAGASSFSVWVDGRQLRCWQMGPGKGDEGCLSAPIIFHGEQLARFQVTGPVLPAYQARLEADADLVSRYLPLKEERTVLANELLDARSQLVALQKLSDAGPPAMGDYSANQAENLLKVKSNAELERLVAEVDLAKKIQASLLPDCVPQVPGLEVWLTSRPALDVGGDFYDFVDGPDGSMNFIIGDISGKGIPAALLMAISLRVIRAETCAGAGQGPDSILTKANSELYPSFSHAVMFLTLFVGRYNPHERVFFYSNAGHSPIIYCPVDAKPQLLVADSIPIGLFPYFECSSNAITLRTGDVLILATDGLNERMNAANRLFGFNRLMSLAGELKACTPRQISETIIEEIERFAGDREQEDDQTLIVIKVVGPDFGK